jgi:choline dehydrogenase
MRRHRKQVEQCRHRPFWRALARLGIDPTGHGWDGWLPVEKAVPARAFSDRALIRSIFWTSIAEIGRRGLAERVRAFLDDWGDPNDIRRHSQEQLCYLPVATLKHERWGSRERLLSTRADMGGSVAIADNTLATRIILDREGRATGVEWLRGKYLYRASPKSSDEHRGQYGESFAAREIILAAGAFATPQLLMLSGIGEADHLASMGISPRVSLPEVGRNLQDRYEIGVVHKIARPWRSLEGACFSDDDRLYRKWLRRRRGMYISNGAAIAALRRSSVAERSDPDLVLMGLMGKFSGYFTGYADECWQGLDAFSWAVLKGQTANRAGSVRLASSDAREPPVIAFRNFAENGERDLDALVEGVEMARSLAEPLIECGAIAEEEIPGSKLKEEALKEWVRANAWGHHACGTAAIGPVLDPHGRVKGVEGLRVVDASIFPRIPGLFIVAAIYLAAEKLAADILANK